MHAIVVDDPGPPDHLTLAEMPPPAPAPGEVLIDVAATAVNRADLLQCQGYYPPPPGASDILGLECSGTVSAVGVGVDRWRVGDQVCALLAGGGYAEKVAVPQGQVLPCPPGISLVDAAALPEVAATVVSNVYLEAGLRPDETLLVHGGAGGIGTFAIQLAHALGSRVLATAGSPAKLDRCRELGADVQISYRDEDFVAVARAEARGGVDVILDIMGGSYLGRNVDALAMGGRVAVIGMQGGTRGELNLGRLLQKRARVIATSLRPRPIDEKAAICVEVERLVWPLVATGAVKPVIDLVLPLDRAGEAHRHLEAGDHTGKIVLVTAAGANR